SEDQVLAAWKGLGYHRRALHLHAAEREAATRHGGELPRSYAALRAMKGIGDYTAAAVASIAFGEPKGAVDGNVLRVMARYLGIEEPVDEARTRRRIQQAEDDAVPRERPGDFNQALMELGATLCLPQRPRCDACPLEASCAARATGAAHRLPVRKRREKVKAERRIVGVVEQGGRVLLVKRPAGGLLGGMWEFLNLEPAGAPGVADEEQLRDALAALRRRAAGEGDASLQPPALGDGRLPSAGSAAPSQRTGSGLRLDLAPCGADARGGAAARDAKGMGAGPGGGGDWTRTPRLARRGPSLELVGVQG